VPVVLATWFIAISAMRLVLVAPGGPGFDGRLYRSATVAWLHGQDPWQVVQGGVWFGAPPPSLIPMIPFALLPEDLAVGLMLAMGVVASAWAIRRLGAPLWWLAFPPLVDGMWNANPHVVVLPLLLASLAPIAIVVKVYAAIVPLVRLEIRALIIAGVAILVTAPFLPWATYLAERELIQVRLDLTAGGGASVFGLDGVVLVVALAASVAAFVVLFRRDRERAAWLAMPAFWPWTQWYYASMAIPGVLAARADRPAPAGDEPPLGSVVLFAVAAAILAAPVTAAPAAALVGRRRGALADRDGASRPPSRTASCRVCLTLRHAGDMARTGGPWDTAGHSPTR
jgi:hypothetical protein